MPTMFSVFFLWLSGFLIGLVVGVNIGEKKEKK